MAKKSAAITTTISLTEPEVRVLRFMVDANDKGGSVSVRDICDAMGWSSPNAAHQHMRRLAQIGMVKLGKGKPASVTEAAMRLYSKRQPTPTTH